MKMFVNLLILMLTTTALSAEEKRECHCTNCVCTEESHCGCFSESGCHCTTDGQCANK